MEDKHTKFQLSQKIVLYNAKDRKFLFVYDPRDLEVCKKYGHWEIPGGRIKTGENPAEALKREISEELGDTVQYEIKNIIGGYIYELSEESRVGLVYLALYKEGEITLSDEHSEMRWQTAEEVEQNDEYYPWLKDVIKNASTIILADERTNDLKRLQADFENYKKRQAKDNSEMSRFMIQGIVSDLVPILDNFHAAVTHVPENEKKSPWVTGITYIEKQFEDVLGNYGVKPLEVKPGDPFDPTRHEAVEMKKADPSIDSGPAETSEGHVIEKVIQKGYMIGDKVVRAAKVIVK